MEFAKWLQKNKWNAHFIENTWWKSNYPQYGWIFKTTDSLFSDFEKDNKKPTLF